MGKDLRSNERPLFLGIEGGGTRTVAILADDQEGQVQRVEAGPGNLTLLAERELAQHLAALGRKLPRPAAVCIGLAGLRSEQDRRRVLKAADQVWPGTPCHACADLETALAAAGPSPRLPRVLVLCGTGSCCYGVSPDGRTAKLGGWGHLLGDKGSAYEIGLRALKAVAYYSDRDAAWPILGQHLLRVLQLNQPDDLIAWAQSADKKEIAALALEVFAGWERRDKIASDILHGAAESLAKDAADCAHHVARPGRKVQFIFAGGVLLRQPRFAKLVSRQLLNLWPMAQITLLEVESAWGAVRLARDRFNRSSQKPEKVAAAPKSQTPVAARHGIDNEVCIPVSRALSPTERRNPRSRRLDKLPLTRAISLMLTEEATVPSILLAEKKQIARCIEAIVRAFRRGGRLFYVGAGTSGRIGALDASECPPTFRVSSDLVQGIMAGGQQALWQSIEGAEDDAAAGADAIRFRGVGPKDIVVGIAASGRTPFVWGALREARRCRAKTLLLCFNPYLEIEAEQRPDLVLAPNLGPEVLTGSTRLKAVTATKLLLNLFTTLSMVRLGKVESNLMVDLNPSNQKLRQRAIRIVRELTRASESRAEQALERSGWVVKSALNHLRG
jgi:N-acetylmuramic acid 6-phosphate etherase